MRIDDAKAIVDKDEIKKELSTLLEKHFSKFEYELDRRKKDFTLANTEKVGAKFRESAWNVAQSANKLRLEAQYQDKPIIINIDCKSEYDMSVVIVYGTSKGWKLELGYDFVPIKKWRDENAIIICDAQRNIYQFVDQNNAQTCIDELERVKNVIAENEKYKAANFNLCFNVYERVDAIKHIENKAAHFLFSDDSLLSIVEKLLEQI